MINNNKIQLSNIQESVSENKIITTNSKMDNKIHGEDLIVIKRDGREEQYKPEKMLGVCMWACDFNYSFAEELMSSTKIKLYNKIKIADVFDQLINTAINKISPLNPKYEMIAAKLQLLKIYRITWKMKTSKQYPSMKQIIDKGIASKVYSKEIFGSYTDEEIEKINKAIDPELDYLFTFKSLITFFTKYCIKSSKTKTMELMQHSYMRVAMALFVNENISIRVNKVIEFYKMISSHYFTVATPIMLNAGCPNSQLSSCVLSKMGDSANSIMDSTKDIAIYSKFKGGNAIDISSIRSSGSYIIGNAGVSSGPVPFLKIVESTIKAFNQGSSRPGACAIYFQWWHLNFEELIVLKSNSGTEENRARHLKYAVKINQLLIDRLLARKNVTLFNPHEVHNLQGKFGKEFEKCYEENEQRVGIQKKVISAEDLFSLMLKERVENGNIYLFHEENVNNASLLNRYINSSNLCCEITLPSRESEFKEQNYITKNGNTEIHKIYKAGEISLCNLASVNLIKWEQMETTKQQKMIDLLVQAMDNAIDLATYPVLEGKISNLKYRYLGIGVLNYANLLASKKKIIDTQEALEYCSELFDNLSYQIIFASHKIAKEKGPYSKFQNSKWSKGLLPIDFANEYALKLTKYKPDKKKWDKLRHEIKKFGIRNAQLMAIAPTATTGKAINATESIEPIQNFFYKEDGKINIITLVPNIKNRKYYKIGMECDQYKLIEAAAIRQMYLDQSQSINMYFKKVTSLTDFTMYHLYAFKLGVKTLYYCKTEKENEIIECESCT
ncbi:MAG: ribonucleoside-diphosphate reductase subunit alpha [Mycoplasmoidaceae bacterium]